MFHFLDKMTNPARKYVDLIHASSSKWANWDPPNQIKVGDYGTVDKHTGEFEKDGNIYDDNEHDLADIVKAYPPEDVAADNTFVVTSIGVKSREFQLGANAGLTGVAEASVKGQWDFGRKRGALLVMANPNSYRIPGQVLLKHLVKLPHLKDKALVTQTFHCHAYSLYLSGEENDSISVALVGSGPAGLPLLNAGGELRMTWWSQYSSGLFREACDAKGQPRYTPLYVLKQIRKPSLFRRDGHPEPEGDELWADAEKPWDPLDDDGVEEEIVDEIFDD